MPPLKEQTGEQTGAEAIEAEAIDAEANATPFDATRLDPEETVLIADEAHTSNATSAAMPEASVITGFTATPTQPARTDAPPPWPAEPDVLDLTACPLDGVNLIEASAGTGKTYTITRLYLRMLCEGGLTVEQILVVTFTIAATEELRDRIRAILRKAVEVLRDPVNVAPDDEVLEYLARSDRREVYLERCRAALRNFESAAIYTIHGFCHRMLREHAFESGISFGMHLAGDQTAYVEELIQDHWRRSLYEADPAFLEYVLGAGLRPENLLNFYRRAGAHPRLDYIEPKGAATDAGAAREAYESLKAELARDWPAERENLHGFLDGDGWLNRRSYSPDRVRRALDEMEAFLKGRPDAFSSSDNFDLLRSSTVAARRTRIPGPDTPEICERFDLLAERARALTDALDRQALALESDLLGRGRGELERKKLAEEVLSYDDLLTGLERALDDEADGTVLRDRIRDSFRAALIDEFQDTDQVQWSILESLFRTDDHALFLIGDPKQSIYSFRGADVFAYIAARRAADRCYGLQYNFRARPALTRAVNALFGRADLRSGTDFGGPFLHEEIPFFPVEAGAKKDPLLIEGRDGSALLLEILEDARKNDGGNSNNSKSYLPKETARNLATDLTVEEINRLLELGRSGRARLGEEPVRPGDIAVLVRTNREADMVQRALRRTGVHAIIRSEKSLFHSREAEELLRVLRAVEQPHSESLLRMALITELIGMSAGQLEALFDDPALRDARLREFAAYRALRDQSGFMVMFRRLLRREGILERLLVLPDGERRVANLLHLGELLYRQSQSGAGRETAWLGRMREKPDNQDEHLPRLESDERAVQIVTVHFSKGLEYPIVFCPFLWNSRMTTTNEALIVHDRGTGRHALLPAIARDRAESAGFDAERVSELEKDAARERLAEDTRLAYVALTRASHRCYLFWGKINRTGDSALAFLLHARAGESLQAFQERARKLSREDILTDLRALARSSPEESLRFALDDRQAAGEYHDMDLPLEAPAATTRPRPENLKRRVFHGEIQPGPVLHSFSSLTADEHTPNRPDPYRAPENADPANMPLATSPAPDSGSTPNGDDRAAIVRDSFSFPRGARAGDFFHELLENVDFADPRTASLLAPELLERHGIGPAWAPTAGQIVSDVLTCPLRDDAGRSIVLSGIGPGDRAPEMDFTFPLPAPGGAPPANLPELGDDQAYAALRANWPNEIAPGFMKGFIDLVFQADGRTYLLDWKSNHLGDDIECYRDQRLFAAMARSDYVLQYYIYSLALHRYLKLRRPDYDYERDFGGVFYVFLRGVRPERGSEFGVYFDRPPAQALAAFENALANRPEGG